MEIAFFSPPTFLSYAGPFSEARLGRQVKERKLYRNYCCCFCCWDDFVAEEIRKWNEYDVTKKGCAKNDGAILVFFVSVRILDPGWMMRTKKNASQRSSDSRSDPLNLPPTFPSLPCFRSISTRRKIARIGKKGCVVVKQLVLAFVFSRFCVAAHTAHTYCACTVKHRTYRISTQLHCTRKTIAQVRWKRFYLLDNPLAGTIPGKNDF